MYHKIVQAAANLIKSACRMQQRNWLNPKAASQVQRKRTSDGGVGKMFHYQLATEVPCD
jgi:hypothetical protein